ncbi:hypothetical protein HDU97_003415 [Phlyctochytrium planicorne]|nr:hypothetical protein HDU97_003415 [Phlyctochytrium planicorne]
MVEPSALVHPFARFYITGRYADAKLQPKLKAEADDVPPSDFPVHKVILAAQSTFFDELFNDEEESPAIAESHDSFPLDDSGEDDDEEKFDDAHQGFTDSDTSLTSSSSTTLVTDKVGQDDEESVSHVNGGARSTPNESKKLGQESASSKGLRTYIISQIDECSLRLALDWFYFGDLDLTLHSVWGVWSASKLFKVPALSARIEGFMDAFLDASELAFEEALDQEIDIMDAAIHISEALIGENEWQQALLKAVRSGAPQITMQRLLDAAVRESIWDERCGHLKSFGGREAMSSVDSALSVLRQSYDSEVEAGIEPGNVGVTKAFRGFRLVRRLIAECDGLGDPISNAEMGILFSTLRFDRFKLDELETIHADSRIPREIVASALMTGLRKREEDTSAMRRTFKTCIQAMGAFKFGKNTLKRIGGTLNAAATISTLSEKAVPEIPKENVTSLDEEDGGTLRIIHLPSAQTASLGVHQAQGPAAGAAAAKAVQSDDSVDTVKGGLDGKLVKGAFPRRVRKALSSDLFASSSSNVSESSATEPKENKEEKEDKLKTTTDIGNESSIDSNDSSLLDISSMEDIKDTAAADRNRTIKGERPFKLMEAIEEETEPNYVAPASTVSAMRPRFKRASLSDMRWAESHQKDFGPPAPGLTQVSQKVPTPELLERAAAKLGELVEKKSLELRDQVEEEQDSTAIQKRHTWAGVSTAPVKSDVDSLSQASEKQQPIVGIEAEPKQDAQVEKESKNSLPTPGESSKASPRSLRNDMSSTSSSADVSFEVQEIMKAQRHSAEQVRNFNRQRGMNQRLAGGDRRLKSATYRPDSRQANEMRKSSAPELRHSQSLDTIDCYQNPDESFYDLQPLPPPMRQDLVAPIPPPHRRHSLAKSPVESPANIPATPKTLMMDLNKSMPPTPPPRSSRASLDRAVSPSLENVGNTTNILDSIHFDDPVDLTLSAFDDSISSTSSMIDATFHWPDTAPPGTYSNQSLIDSRASPNGSNGAKRVPNPISSSSSRKSTRKTSVIPSSSLNGETKKVVATVGTWGPSSNPLGFNLPNRSDRNVRKSSSRPSLNLTTIAESTIEPPSNSKGTWGMKEAAYVSAKLEEFSSRTSEEVSVKNSMAGRSSSVASIRDSIDVDCAPVEGDGIKVVPSARKSASIKYLSMGKNTLSTKNFKEFMGKVKKSKSRNRAYFYNKETQESVWELPAGEVAAPREVVDEARASHILVKHRDSRRPASWRQDPITRTKEEAYEIVRGKLSQGVHD